MIHLFSTPEAHTVDDAVMGGLGISVVLAALLESASAIASSHELYDNVVPADTADCLER